MGTVMGVGRGTYDIVALMTSLGFGWWALLSYGLHSGHHSW